MIRPLRKTSDFGSENSQEREGAVGGVQLKQRGLDQRCITAQCHTAERRSRSLPDLDAFPAHAGNEKGCSDSFQKQGIVINKTPVG